MKLSRNQQKQHDNFLKLLGEQIVSIRKKKGMSQMELAYAIGMEKPNLRQIEKGKRNITIKTLLLISEGLEISMSELIKLSEGKVERSN